MASFETVTLETDLTPHEVAVRWPAEAPTWICNVQKDQRAVSCKLTERVGGNQKEFVSLIFEEMPSIKRIVWTQFSNTMNTCSAEVYERTPGEGEKSTRRIFSTSGQWRETREAVRERFDIPLRTGYDIDARPPDIKTVPREETPY